MPKQIKLAAIFGSPRREGNTATLLTEAINGARTMGAEVDAIHLRDYKLSPCLEIYGCQKTGQCVIQDDFQGLLERILAADGVILASPIFFYAVSAHTKIFMDRCQSRWVKKHWLERQPLGKPSYVRQGLFISVGATQGKKLFEGPLLSVKYFFDVLDTRLWRSLLFRGLDGARDVLRHAEYLSEAAAAGRQLVVTLDNAVDSDPSP